MSLTDTQIQLIKKSWRGLHGIRPELIADIFYTKLFTDYPRLRKMFPRDMQAQYTKIMDMLSSIVTQLNNLENLSAEITAMAHRHVGYGVEPDHYKSVGNALLWTLKQGLGKDWTPETEKAWTTCYTLLADTMIKSAYHNGKV